MDQHFFMSRRGIENKISNVEYDDVNEQYKVHPSKWAPTNIKIDSMVSAIIHGIDSRGWVFFSDASASSYSVGWSFAVFKNGLCKIVCNGALTRCYVYMAKAYTLYQAVKYVNKITGLGRKEEVEIRSDAQGLVRSLGKVLHINALISRIKDELRIAYHAGKNIVVRWVPGHKHIAGNEYADSLAKRGVDSRAVTPIPMMKNDAMRIIREKEKAVEENNWSEFESKNIKLFLPDINMISKFLKSSPSIALCQLVSGHTSLNDFVCKKLGLIKSSFCECQEDTETVSHFLFECPLYEKLREEIWEDFQPTYEYIIKDWAKLNDFVAATGRFEKSLRECLGEGNKE